SFLITSTSIHLNNGRHLDIYGRKATLAMALSIMGVDNFTSGFSSTPLELLPTRAIKGFGARAIRAFVQIVFADITRPKQRDSYLDMVGTVVAFGNELGPLIRGTLTRILV
ncbi:hypothetical protein BKA67DRAFT_527302, partial [Truncatella angustata]